MWLDIWYVKLLNWWHIIIFHNFYIYGWKYRFMLSTMLSYDSFAGCDHSSYFCIIWMLEPYCKQQQIYGDVLFCLDGVGFREYANSAAANGITVHGYFVWYSFVRISLPPRCFHYKYREIRHQATTLVFGDNGLKTRLSNLMHWIAIPRQHHSRVASLPWCWIDS